MSIEKAQQCSPDQPAHDMDIPGYGGFDSSLGRDGEVHGFVGRVGDGLHERKEVGGDIHSSGRHGDELLQIYVTADP